MGGDGDVEMLRFRKARRKERPKMKHLGSDQCKDAKRRNSCRFLHSRAQQGSVGRMLNQLVALRGIVILAGCILCM